MAKKKKKLRPKAKQLLESITDLPASPTDPAGSYTGRPIDPAERPVQDADDL